MSQQEVIYLVGDFRSDVLERWTLFAQRTNHTIKHINMDEIDDYSGNSPILILCDDALNHAHLPGTPPCKPTN